MTDTFPDYRQARQQLLEYVKVCGTENVPLADAGGRILAEDLVAGWNLPRHDNSAMDGFAVRSVDCSVGAELLVAGTVAAGSDESFEVVAGGAVRIMTGAIIPSGADAVVPIEQVDVAGDVVSIRKDVTRGDHIRLQGEDLQKGSVALTAGVRLSPAELGLLATFGCGTVKVFRRPKIAVLATGNELAVPGNKLGTSQIYDSNSTALCAAVIEAGGEPIPLGIARDDRNSLLTLISQGLQADLLITAAGASVGDFDLVRDVLGDLDAEEVFWGVSIKPGKPTAFCLVQGKPVFCLPGNPVSALVTFELFARPALLKMQGANDVLPATVQLPLAESMKKKAARTLFARVRLVNSEEGLFVRSAGSQQTGIMTSLVCADGLAILPDGQSEFGPGEKVEVLLLHQK